MLKTSMTLINFAIKCNAVSALGFYQKYYFQFRCLETGNYENALMNATQADSVCSTNEVRLDMFVILL